MDGQLSFAPLDYAGRHKARRVSSRDSSACLDPDSAATRARSGPQSRGGRAIPGQGFISQTGFQPGPDGKTLAADGSNCCKSVLTRDGYPAHTTQL